VDLVGLGRPSDAVAGMNPNFVRQEGQSLVAQIMTLGANGGMPRFSQNCLRDDQDRERQKPTENGSERERVRSFHFFP
jgi:hypothetical protein